MSIEIRADTIVYPPHLDEEVRGMLQSRFGRVCREHEGEFDDLRMWGLFTFRHRETGEILNCAKEWETYDRNSVSRN